MSQQKPTVPAPSLNAQDILYILFKHKGKILLSAVIGVCAAAAVYLLRVPIYESQAKLLVRYVVDTSAIDQVESSVTRRPLKREPYQFRSRDSHELGFGDASRKGSGRRAVGWSL